MDKSAIDEAIASGQNLALCGRKVMLLVGTNDRPGNCVTVANLESGKQYVCGPHQIKMVGTVDTAALPWKLSQPEGMADEAVNTGVPWPFKTVTGETVKPGEKITLSSGETAIFLGQNPKAPRFPLNIKLLTGNKAGRILRCTVGHVRGLAA